MTNYIITRKSTGHTLGVYAGETPADECTECGCVIVEGDE
jgi:hypothetical protein